MAKHESVQTIAARKTQVVPVETPAALSFVEQHHRSGKARPGKKTRAFGLLYNDDLLAVAIFCNPRTKGKQREYTTELFRLAFKAGVRVQGGASKLLKHFMQSDASDLFTYQDTSGEVTSVYEHAGMTLKGPRNPKKKILVRDGLTAEAAENNRRDWFSLEQASRRGPDTLIGTELGEVVEEGKRVSNVELFKRNGYHLETVPGDRVYKWHNPKFMFYTYRITSTEDSSYYFGRHRTIHTDQNEMAVDGYMGSGGTKYQNWTASVGTATLQKEILAVYSTWAESVKAEGKLIGDLHKSDPLCKNSRPGGTGIGGYFLDHVMKNCPIHGESLHQGNSCKKCSMKNSLSVEECSAHGSTIFRSGLCLRCKGLDDRDVRLCPIHGESKHHGNSCEKCLAAKAYSMRECAVHGSTLHMYSRCKKCIADAAITLLFCPVHGETKHLGSACRKCIANRTVAIKTCATHGDVLHQSDSCASCVSENRISLKSCPIHGVTKFVGDTCATCSSQKGVNVQECSIHGVTKHMGDRCKRCMAVKSLTLKMCPVHGESKHMGEVCKKCSAAKVWTVEECRVHGESKHRSGKCEKCSRVERAASS